MENMNFGAVLDAADDLSVEEQEALIDVLRHRVADANRQVCIQKYKPPAANLLKARGHSLRQAS